jgi:hypothetical protein
MPTTLLDAPRIFRPSYGPPGYFLSRCFVTAYQLMYLNVSRTRRAGQDDMIVQCLKLLHTKKNVHWIKIRLVLFWFSSSLVLNALGNFAFKQDCKIKQRKKIL